MILDCRIFIWFFVNLMSRWWCEVNELYFYWDQEDQKREHCPFSLSFIGHKRNVEQTTTILSLFWPQFCCTMYNVCSFSCVIVFTHLKMMETSFRYSCYQYYYFHYNGFILCVLCWYNLYFYTMIIMTM